MRSLSSIKYQSTVSDHVTLQGIGLHSGAETILRIHPAKTDNGIVFVRNDVSDRNNRIPALWHHVVDTKLCSVIGNEDGVTVGTIEHIMAALHALNITNATIELDGPEVPIMDGSSDPFIKAINAVGIDTQTASQKAIKVIAPIEYKDEDKFVTLTPSDETRYTMDIDFTHGSIGKQSYSMVLSSDNFASEVSNARTFGFAHEVNHLRSLGLCLGGSLDNAVVLDEEKILNPEGLRHDNEFARHKLLDAIGDLYLAGQTIIAEYKGYKAGHEMNNKVLEVLFANPDKWELIDAPNTAFKVKEHAL